MGAKSKALNDTLVAGLSDIRFTDTNRVPRGSAVPRGDARSTPPHQRI